MTRDTTTTSGERDTKGRWGGGEIAENKGTPVPPQQCIDDALIDRDERHAYVVACFHSTTRRTAGGTQYRAVARERVRLDARHQNLAATTTVLGENEMRACKRCLWCGWRKRRGGGEGGKNTHALCATVYLAPEFEDTNLPSLRIQK